MPWLCSRASRMRLCAATRHLGTGQANRAQTLAALLGESGRFRGFVSSESHFGLGSRRIFNCTLPGLCRAKVELCRSHRDAIELALQFTKPVWATLGRG